MDLGNSTLRKALEGDLKASTRETEIELSERERKIATETSLLFTRQKICSCWNRLASESSVSTGKFRRYH